LAVVLGVTLLYGGLTSGTAFGSYNPAWDGTSELRDVSTASDGDARIVEEQSGYDVSDPSETVSFVLSPDTAYSEREMARIERFVRAGGTLVVAEDVGPHSDELLAGIGAETRFAGARLRDERFYVASPTMPVATNPANETATEGVGELALNHATAVVPGNATVLVNTSSYAYLDRNGNDALDGTDDVREYPVVTRERVGNGTVVAIGDPSVFINAMIDRRDNRQFARSLVEAHSVRLFDVSHVAGLPPLVAAQLFLRDSPLVQLTLGIGLVVVLTYVRVPKWVRRRVGGQSTSPLSGSGATDESSVVAWVEARRPDWDAERVRRVSEGISRQKRNRERDD
jgi:hypothetical protein